MYVSVGGGRGGGGGGGDGLERDSAAALPEMQRWEAVPCSNRMISETTVTRYCPFAKC
jgi:hypothetical protein